MARGVRARTGVFNAGALTFIHGLTGDSTIGVYPLLADDTCYFVAIDFDEAEWKDDARAFVRSCSELGVPDALEISRSGKGAHAWVFFAGGVSARDARRLGTAIISHTCSRTRQLKLESYDRLFPNQDTMPKGGFGNLIALPLQKKPRENGGSVFVDADLRPYADQWNFLASVQLMASYDIEPTILRATGKLVGEGFDHPALDTLVLAMPVSWKGTLQQYSGRLHPTDLAAESDGFEGGMLEIEMAKSHRK